MIFRILYFDVKNKDGRIYKKENFDLDLINEKASKGMLLGEMGVNTDLDISLSKVSHVINKITRDDLGLMADIRILKTTNGDIVKNLLSSLVLRPRGAGNINSNGLVENYKFVTCDFINKSDDTFNISSVRRMLLRRKLKKVKLL